MVGSVNASNSIICCLVWNTAMVKIPTIAFQYNSESLQQSYILLDYGNTIVYNLCDQADSFICYGFAVSYIET